MGGGAGAAARGLRGPAEAVEDLQLRGGERQLAVLVLAVEGEQALPQALQVGDGGGAAVDVRAGPPVGADAPREHDLLGVGGEQLAALGVQLRGQREAALDVGLGGAGAHDPGAGAPAEQQVEGVGEDGLAGAGLAGEDVQPGGQLELGPLDQEEVLDAQFVQHNRRSISERRRIAGAGVSDRQARRRRIARRAGDQTPRGLGARRTPRLPLIGCHLHPRCQPTSSARRHGCPKATAIALLLPPPACPRGARSSILGAPALAERVREEVNRAGRHGTALSCLLIDVEDLREIERLHGAELAQRTLAYAGLALRRELRGFDRVGRPSAGELLVVLPGADGPRGEIVARRVLGRLRAIKLEARGERRALRLAVGLATWRAEMSAEGLLARGARGGEPRAARFPGCSPALSSGCCA